MNLRQARICLNDDEVFEGEHCPRCGQKCFAFLTAWIKPSIFKYRGKYDNHPNHAPGPVLPSQS